MSTQLKKFIIENVRCFGERQEIDIRPLTFLVGENSTGKTSILACLQVLLQSYHGAPSFRGEPILNFNEPPYDMGTFIDIIHKTKPAGNNFILGHVLEDKNINNGNPLETLNYVL